MFIVYGYDDSGANHLDDFGSLAAAKRYADETARYYPEWFCCTVVRNRKRLYEVSAEDFD